MKNLKTPKITSCDCKFNPDFLKTENGVVVIKHINKHLFKVLKNCPICGKGIEVK